MCDRLHRHRYSGPCDRDSTRAPPDDLPAVRAALVALAPGIVGAAGRDQRRGYGAAKDHRRTRLTRGRLDRTTCRSARRKDLLTQVKGGCAMDVSVPIGVNPERTPSSNGKDVRGPNRHRIRSGDEGEGSRSEKCPVQLRTGVPPKAFARHFRLARAFSCPDGSLPGRSSGSRQCADQVLINATTATTVRPATALR